MGAALSAIERVLGSGWFPAVSIVEDLIYVAFGAQPDPLVLVVLTREGVEVRRQTMPGFIDSFPRFGGRWLAYKRNLDWRPVAIDVVSGEEHVFQGQADGNFGLVVNDALGLVAYQWGIGFPIWLGSLFSGAAHQTQLAGAPDGLDTLLDSDHVTLRKDTRLSVPGMFYPRRAGDLVVGERPDGGIAVQLEGDVLRVALAGQDTPTPACATDGTTYAIVTGGAQGVRLWLGSSADLKALPLALDVPRPVDVPRIGKPCLVAWFTDRQTEAPGHANVWVNFHDTNPDPPAALVRRRDTGEAIAQYVAGNPDGDLGSLNARIAAARAAAPSLPVIAYWSRGAQAVGLPDAAALVGVEAYRLEAEPIEVFETRIRVYVGFVGSCVLIGQAYTSNAAQTSDLASVVPVLARIAKDYANVLGVCWFGAGSRPTGYDDHPDVHPLYAALFAGVTGIPNLLPPASVPVPPPAPKPRPPAPTPAPTPKPSPLPHEEDIEMNLPARCYALLHNSNIAAVSPGSSAVELDHAPQEFGAYQEIEVTKSSEWTPTNPRVLVRFVAANRLFRVNKVLAQQRKYEQCCETWDPAAGDADSSWQQGLAAGPFVHFTGDSADGTRHGIVYTLTCVDKGGQLFR